MTENRLNERTWYVPMMVTVLISAPNEEAAKKLAEQQMAQNIFVDVEEVYDPEET